MRKKNPGGTTPKQLILSLLTIQIAKEEEYLKTLEDTDDIYYVASVIDRLREASEIIEGCFIERKKP